MDAFLTVTSTQDGLEETSFLSHLDMDPPPSVPNKTLAGLASPSTKNLLPEGVYFGGLASPPPEANAPEKREVFDFKRFVNFAVRREKEQR